MFRGIYRGKHVHADDLQLVIQRAKNAGVQKLIITGTNLEESREAAAETQKDGQDQFLYSTVGCHPTRSDEFEAYESGPAGYFNALFEVATTSKNVIAIGECGLAQLVKANRHKFSHGVVHSFTGTVEEMHKLVELDLYIGINGCSLKTEENLKVVKEIPEDKLMIETGKLTVSQLEDRAYGSLIDSPWCDIRPTHASFAHLSNVSKDEMALYAPATKKKEKFEMGCTVKSRNEPCAIGMVLHVVASVKGSDPHVLAEKVWANTCKVFFPSATDE
ncbi:TatD DNase [Apophysomyces ossiformis]|uniref:TatD DNase n=1 Tax=Apophysomyces ossiformis TaxID=679940 RepID=A0A8H7EUR8_9FUNG|nr:TatD DNase [Apophysomyces ossiformis]